MQGSTAAGCHSSELLPPCCQSKAIVSRARAARVPSCVPPSAASIGPAGYVGRSLKQMSQEHNSLSQQVLQQVLHNQSCTPAMFDLLDPCASLSSTERLTVVQEVIHGFAQRLEECKSHSIGYPGNLDVGDANQVQLLQVLNNYSLNNAGDPFAQVNYGLHSRQFEVAVLRWFAQLWHISDGDYWGYVTSGSTESNLQALLMARENLPDAILYSSRESHFSIPKAAAMYRMEAQQVNTQLNGEMDYDDFRACVTANKPRAAIINLNIGTTVKGAVDCVDKVLEILQGMGYTHDRFYIHCDAALSGIMLPYLDDAPSITFNKPISSISVSGHKFLGAPMPCGVIITRQQYVAALADETLEIINSKDLTITCSRSGHAPIYLWQKLMLKGHEGIKQDVQRCLNNAQMLNMLLQEAAIKTFHNPLSTTVVFERPTDETLVHRWQLACQGHLAHVVVMPHVTRQKLHQFVEEYVASRRAVVATTAGIINNGSNKG